MIPTASPRLALSLRSILVLTTALALAAISACRTNAPAPHADPHASAEQPEELANSTRVVHHDEQVFDFASLIVDAQEPAAAATPSRSTATALERVTTAVPWPRGLAWVDGELVVLARGRHRNSGGVEHSIPDRPGHLFRVDPYISERVVPGQPAAAHVAGNAELLASPDSDIFYLPDTSLAPALDRLMDRPYCTLAYDPASRNLFICGYSGVDLPERQFVKNATDSIHRYDMRSERWYPVERHDPAVVPSDLRDWVVPNEYYPHHDPAANPAPHGWLNGPDGCVVTGEYLVAISKDNHLICQYDLSEVRDDPQAGYPASRPVLGAEVRLAHPGGVLDVELQGPSAVATRDGWLYVGYRTSAVIVRYPLEEDGRLNAAAPGFAGQLIAVFEPWDATSRRSANLIDLAFNSRGELFVSCAKQGRVWNIGLPDPRRPFLGNDQLERPTSAPPFLDVPALTGRPGGIGNILFDDQDHLYICSGNYDSDSDKLAGVVYRTAALSE